MDNRILNIFYSPHPCNGGEGGGLAVDGWGEYYDENCRKIGKKIEVKKAEEIERRNGLKKI